MTLLLVAVGAVVGAPLRFVVERLLAGSWPWGTFVVNVAGSAVLGAAVGAVGGAGTVGAPAPVLALVGIGFCGAVTTFGGFAAQVLDLAADPGASGAARSLRSVGYALLSVAACTAAAAAAWLVTRSA